MATRRTTTRRTAPRAAARDGAAVLDSLEWRLAGPFRGGRCVAVAGDPNERLTFYMGSTGGGVWKTTDAGRYWRNVSDGYFKRASVGAIAVAASDPNVIYVGMGEACIRGNVSHGDGVYRSTDAGKSWTHLGLADTRNIGKVRVDPRDPDTAYVAALGHAHGPNAERGVFRTRDGGRTWKKVLYRGEDAGAIDIALDPGNPRVIYATTWEARRGPHYLNSGGPGSGLWKSTDAGDTWTELSRNKGLPRMPFGKIGIAVSGARPDRVFALVEAKDGAVYRSDDGGETWQKLCDDRNLRQRAWYYHHIYTDPKDAETVWVLNVDTWRSSDAGATFQQVEIPHGDNHDLWIDPADPLRMIEGNDGGATVSLDGGRTWSSIYNQPTAEMYHVHTDMRTPYWIYGAQQDNTTAVVPSRARLSAITNHELDEIGGGESGYIAIRPDDPNIVYAGSYQGFISRYDHRTLQSRNIMVWPEMSSGQGAGELKYRFQWTFPIVLSPHDPNELYVTGNRVFRSHDEGQTWEAVSPDLTRNEPTRLRPSGGEITKDNTGAEYYCTIFAFAESPVTRGVLWAGSDDGLVHVSRDAGKTWRNVTPKGLPPWALVSIIEPSPFDAGTAYVAATRYKLDDFRPYLFRTRDHGRTWTKITGGIDAGAFTRVVRADPKRKGLLFAGTETGVYASFDDGARWRRLGGNLPVVPIHDLVVKDDDLVLGTHGRSFWVLDDITPIREAQAAAARERAVLFPPRPTVRIRSKGGFPAKPVPGINYRFTGAAIVPYVLGVDKETGEKKETLLDAAKNPPDGVAVQYWFRERPQGEVTLTFLDARGRQIRTFSSRKDDEEAAPEPEAAMPAEGAETVQKPGAGEAEKKEPVVPKKAGLNRFVWNMRYPDATKVEDDASMDEFERALAGPIAVPGRYQVRLKAEGRTYTVPFETRIDPRLSVTQRDLQAQFDLLLRIRDQLSRTHDTINEIRALRTQVEDWERRAAKGRPARAVVKAAASLRKELTGIEEELIQTKAKSRQDTLNYPIKLNAKVAGLAAAVSMGDGRPTASAEAVYDDLVRRIDAQVARFEKVRASQVRSFNSIVRRERYAPVEVRAAAAT
ncbi:MAG TPA: glycosyl hydrolase [Candidatus Limnocylindria bacterium]|nr:glycosyl hydrolase [Candidatus Limnocylindria bacterium]